MLYSSKSIEVIHLYRVLTIDIHRCHMISSILIGLSSCVGALDPRGTGWTWDSRMAHSLSERLRVEGWRPKDRNNLGRDPGDSTWGMDGMRNSLYDVFLILLWGWIGWILRYGISQIYWNRVCRRYLTFCGDFSLWFFWHLGHELIIWHSLTINIFMDSPWE